MRSLKAQLVVRFLPQLCDLDARVAQLLREYVKDHTGLLFPSRSGSPRSCSNVYNRDLRPKLEKLGFYVPGAGAHCFRRFRAAQF
jgi:hypothetical protein